MTETAKLSLPFVQAAQAQKHVTVNEAFSKLDALVQLRLVSGAESAPPGTPAEGDAYGVGPEANGDWLGRDGEVAVFANGGWLFVEPGVGWHAWLMDAGTQAIFDGEAWVPGAGSVSAHGAAFVHRSIEIDHAVAAGSTSTVVGAIPGDSIVYGVTGRVIEAVGGVASLGVGVSGSAARYGSGIGPVPGAYVRGLTGNPLTYYPPTDLLLSAEGGSFDGTGRIRLVVHYAQLTLPRI